MSNHKKKQNYHDDANDAHDANDEIKITVLNDVLLKIRHDYAPFNDGDGLTSTQVIYVTLQEVYLVMVMFLIHFSS